MELSSSEDVYETGFKDNLNEEFKLMRYRPYGRSVEYYDTGSHVGTEFERDLSIRVANKMDENVDELLGYFQSYKNYAVISDWEGAENKFFQLTAAFERLGFESADEDFWDDWWMADVDELEAELESKRDLKQFAGVTPDELLFMDFIVDNRKLAQQWAWLIDSEIEYHAEEMGYDEWSWTEPTE